MIAKAAVDCPGTGRAVVLGSGSLFDVPLDALAERFGRVDLVDLAHPRSARLAAQRRPNVRLVEADVSGVARAVVDAHLAWLQNHPGRVVLITEVMRLFLDGDKPVKKTRPAVRRALDDRGRGMVVGRRAAG